MSQWHLNHPDHGRPSPIGPPSGGDSYGDFETMSDDFSNTYPTEPPYYPPGQQQAQQQETHAVYSYHSYQQRSEASGQTHGGSYNRASHSSSSADPWRSPTLDVQRGGRQGPPYYQSQADLPPTLHSSHSVHSHTSRTSQYQPSAGPAYPAGHRPSRGDFPTDDYQSSMTMSHTAFDPAISSSHGTMQRHYAGEPATSSRVPHGVSPEIPELSVKNRERRQIEAPNGTDDRTSPSPTEESSELGFGVKLGGWELWYQNKNKKRSSHSGRRSSTNSERGLGSK